MTSTPNAPSTSRRPAAIARRVAWASWAAFLLAFALFEAVKYGTGVWLALIGGLIAPDLTFLAAVGVKEKLRRGQLAPRAVPYYNALHRTWVPLAIALVYSVGIVDWPALFTFLLAWMLHIAVDRIAGYGLRTKEGFVRG
ncbi:DUF4260 family protein [Actinopolymorpha alba]|uniref:DUF4260 family protein n=1 Tax=Actinopolymorpha alba TaxID=533267 RepID=UPI0003797788|nr:DUF4260 family protein [Actinopolymorpha alba]